MIAPLWLLWDASALVKKYLEETGSETVDALFVVTPLLRMTSTLLGYAETTAILRRKFNQGSINLREFNLSRQLLEHEVLIDPKFELLSLGDDAILQGIQLTDQHNLNTSDAAILAEFLRHVRTTSVSCVPVLVASDRRLLRAAAAEGLRTLDPAAVPLADLPTVLAGS